MTNKNHILQPDKGQPAILIHLIDKTTFKTWLNKQPERIRQAVNAHGFKAENHQLAILPGDKTSEWSALVGIPNISELDAWSLAKAAASLPEGVYRVADHSPGPAMLGWVLGQYQYNRYKKDSSKQGPRTLLTDNPSLIDETFLITQAISLVRDLVNTPACDLGPADLQKTAEEIAAQCNARTNITSGADLENGFPMIAAVGRAAVAERAPRLIELEWGDQRHPRLAIIGKGVIFDSGGLDIKPSSAMRLMKKDMGGAAHALALAQLIMKSRLPVRLHLLVPVAENAISGNAMRPGDILKSRRGLTVEISNTDAEGRLILGDALTKAVENEPELIIDFATLTGAARVALGPDLPAMFANDDALAQALLASGKAVCDPLWQMPLWKQYEEMLASDVADISNAADSPMAGAITAALFLQKFIPETTSWAHIDTFSWRPKAQPGRPKGGDALGLHAAWQMLKTRYLQ